MRKCDVVKQPETIAFANANGRCRPLADSVQGDDRRLVERTGEKCAGRVAFMMVGENQTGVHRPTETTAQGPAHVQLVLEPKWHGHTEAAETLRCVSQVGFE